MKKRAATARKRKSPATRAKSRGLHPVFGPVADPGPDDIGGGWGGWGGWGGGWGGWHGGPVADPGPGFGGWHGTILGGLDRNALDTAAMKDLSALRVRRINASIRALEEHAAIAQEEFKFLSRFADKLRPEAIHRPPWVDPGDPGPELKPIDYLRYVYELRTSIIERTIDYMKESLKAVQAVR